MENPSEVKPHLISLNSNVIIIPFHTKSNISVMNGLQYFEKCV